ncbi:MAG: hypothetical protein JSU00_01455 [Acidobacteria bacterium]|nr:hypothetical protein [Acidobacteriota bacterium]
MHFRALFDVENGSFVEVYSLRAGPQRSLNLVETTPEGQDALKGDVHEDVPEAKTFSPAPVPGIEGPNSGWSGLGAGRFTNVEIVEAGPLRGRIRLSRAGETQEIVWTATGAWFRWKAARGFRFTAVSATPYLPFNRVLDGAEIGFPDGPGSPEPTPNQIGPRNWPSLPGGHIVYYQREEDYGALGIVALDPALKWRGVGTRRFIAEKGAGEAEIAVTFPAWAGSDTVLEARKEYRMLKQPLLVQVSKAGEGTVEVKEPAQREPAAVQDHASATPFSPVTLSLDGEWELAFCEKGEGPPKEGWRRVTVPGTVHTQWLDPSKIYSHEAEWLSYKEWWYRRTVNVPDAWRDRRLRLQFDATDYYADTYVNGEYVGRHEGYIDPYEYDVTGRLHTGANEVMVRVWTPVSYYWRHRPYTIKGAYGAVDQKPDDITALGITRSARIVAGDRAVIRDVAVNTRLDGAAGVVEVTVAAELPADSQYRWEVSLAPRNFSSSERYQVRAEAGADPQTLAIRVEKPHLWWTRDHGLPNLYTLEVRLIDGSGRAVDGRTMAAGIREIEKIGWDFYLNRKRMFIRGTNYYDVIYMSTMNRASYERDLKLMIGMNINMIRLHCHFSKPEFYDIADEQGILIWQDFLEAWYPHDVAFAQRAAALYDNHVRYVRNHPSVAIWITSDEEDFTNYHQVTKHLAPRPFFLDPQHRAVHRSTGRFGDSHVYHGWYNGTIWQYTRMTEAFVSELGATSLPNYDTLVKFMGDQWPIRDHEAEWIWRKLQIPEAMRAWGDPGSMSMREYIPQTQAYVARLFQIALERMRERKGEGAGGVLHFHALDIWPSVTMAAIDWERVPTKVWDTVRRSFEPVAALFQYDRDVWKPGERFACGLWAVNDRWTAVNGASLRWTIEDATGKALKSGAIPVSMAADSAARVGTAEWVAGAAGAYRLRAGIVGADGAAVSENLYEFAVR